MLPNPQSKRGLLDNEHEGLIMDGEQIILTNLKHLELPRYTKAEKTALIAPQGTLIYDSTAKKISIKTEDANVIGSWELVTSVDDS